MLQNRTQKAGISASQKESTAFANNLQNADVRNEARFAWLALDGGNISERGYSLDSNIHKT